MIIIIFIIIVVVVVVINIALIECARAIPSVLTRERDIQSTMCNSIDSSKMKSLHPDVYDLTPVKTGCRSASHRVRRTGDALTRTPVFLFIFLYFFLICFIIIFFFNNSNIRFALRYVPVK